MFFSVVEEIHAQCRKIRKVQESIEKKIEIIHKENFLKVVQGRNLIEVQSSFRCCFSLTNSIKLFLWYGHLTLSSIGSGSNLF